MSFLKKITLRGILKALAQLVLVEIQRKEKPK